MLKIKQKKFLSSAYIQNEEERDYELYMQLLQSLDYKNVKQLPNPLIGDKFFFADGQIVNYFTYLLPLV